jgi:hypothetical protein
MPGRGATNSYRDVSVGLSFKVQARLSGESDIALVADFEKSEIVQRKVDANEELGSVPSGVTQLTHNSTSRIHDGHSLLVGTLVSQSPDGVVEAYLVLSVSIDKSSHPKQLATLHSSSPKPASRADSGQAKRGSDGIVPRLPAYFNNLLVKYDLNRDKVLDAEERSKMSKDCSEADADQDGLVTLEEFVAWGEKRLHP